MVCMSKRQKPQQDEKFSSRPPMGHLEQWTNTTGLAAAIPETILYTDTAK